MISWFSEINFLTFVCSPNSLHSVSMKSHPCQLAEGFSDVEVAQRGNLKARHFVSTGIVLGLLRCHLSFERQMKSVSHENLRNTRCMLFHFLDPPVNALEAPFVGDIVH
jgi:hypothetical protein